MKSKTRADRSPRLDAVSRRVALAGCLVLAAAAFAAPALGEVVFTHDPPAAAVPARQLSLIGLVAGLPPGGTVAVHHRTVGEGDYESMEVTLQGGVFEVVLPPHLLTPPGLEYWFGAEDADGELWTLPEGAPDLPGFTVTVAADADAEAASGLGSAPVITILAPDPDASLEQVDLVVVAAFVDADGDLAPSGLTLLANGRDVTSQATVTEELLTWVPAGELPAGTLRIELSAVDLAGNRAATRAISFHLASAGLVGTSGVDVGARDVPDRATVLAPPTGRFAFDSRFTGLEGDGAASRQEPARTIIGRLDARGELGFVDYRVKIFRTSDEDESLPMRNRARVDLDAGRLKAGLGDVTPRFNPLTIWGKRTRGLELKADLGGVHAHFLYGNTRRAIEGTNVDDPDGTYQRKLRGLRLGVGERAAMGFALSALKVKDDIESIEFGLKPKDNVVVGADTHLRLLDRRLLIDAAASMSFLTDDISGGSITSEEADTTFGIDLPFDPKDYEDILVLNTSTTPLDPRDLSNLAVQATAKSNVRGNLLELRFRRIGSVYQSLGATSLPRDQQGFRIKDSFGLMKRRLRLTGEFHTFRDNLSKDRIATKDSRIAAGSVAYVPWSGRLTGLRAGFRVYSQANDLPADSLGAVDAQTVLLTLGGGVRLPVRGFKNELKLSFLTSQRADDVNESGDSEGSNLVADLRSTFPSRPLTLGVLLGFSRNNYPGLVGGDGTAGVYADFTTLQLSADWKRAKLPLRATFRTVGGAGDMSGANSRRTSMTARAEYKFNPLLSFTGRIGFTNFDDRSANNLDYDESFIGFGLEQRF